MRLQTRLLWVVLPFLTVAVSITAAGLSYFSQQTVLSQARQDGQLLASVLGQSIAVSRGVEHAVGRMISVDLVSSANIVAHYVALAEQCRLSSSDITQRLRALVTPDHLAEIWVTDSLGKAYLHTEPGIDFTFSPDPVKQPQASAFWPLLAARQPMSVVQELKPREVDGRPFKYVGVSGVDKPRIVQVGMDGQRLMQVRKSLGVQELLEHVVREEALLRAWVVDSWLEIEQFADQDGTTGQRALTAEDRALLQEAIASHRTQGRLDDAQISVAAPLDLLEVSHLHAGKTRPGTHDQGTGADRSAGALLLHMSTALQDQLLWRESLLALAIASLSLLVGSLLVVSYTRRVARPLQEAVVAAERVASGDLTVDLAVTGTDEVSQLMHGLSQMVDYLNSLIGQVQRSTIELVSTANSLSAMSRTQSEEVNNLGSTTTEIAAATQEISATSEELLNTMAGLTQVAEHTTELANVGQTSLGDMEQAMRTLAEATQSISGRLGLINERATTIGSVTTTIAKIADQTNLLSLNASIEAEKAGEYGLGFAVLAREIRRLADQTAVATLDIEQMVREMQEAVTGGVMEMDKFAERVNHSVADTHAIGLRFGEIIQQVQVLLPQFEAVHEGMRSQSAGARQIRDAMVSLTESVRVSARALEQTTSATQRLEGAIEVLRNEIALFKLR